MFPIERVRWKKTFFTLLRGTSQMPEKSQSLNYLLVLSAYLHLISFKNSNKKQSLVKKKQEKYFNKTTLSLVAFKNFPL